ncbi:MAG: iron-sulfur cluster assembly accessory protein [Gemmatimonadetes bacterium 21-71-4]|nr:MAG: iron-sulfur cluster assembly accessory protein [Gemmatimonadetes bacterium 21-71-4]
MGTTSKEQADIQLSLTPGAAEQVRKVLAAEGAPAETAGLRVGVMPGGCSGFKYSLSVEDAPAGDDAVIETEGVRLFVDSFSGQYLNGVTIDYMVTMQSSGFTFENPNASGGCGCGSSFSV